MNKKTKIEKKKAEYRDLFKRLEAQQEGYWIGKNDKQKKSASAFMYIHVLQAIEDFVIDAQNDNTPFSEAFRKPVESYEYPIRPNKFQEYFNSLRFDPLWFIDGHVQSEKARIFLDAHQVLATQKSIIDTNSESVPVYLSMPVENIKHNKLVSIGDKRVLFIQFKNTIKKEANSPATQIKNRERYNLACENRDSVTDYVDACFDVCPQLFVLCMDLGYPSINQNGTVSASIDSSWLQTHWTRLIQQLALTPDIIGHFEKLELSQLKGFSLHGVFLCRNEKSRLEKYWVDLIGKLWLRVTQGLGAYHNCNPSIRIMGDKSSKYAVGVIKTTESTKRDALQHWVVDYVTLSPQYLSVTVPEGYCTLSLGKTPFQIPLNNPGTENKPNSLGDLAYALNQEAINECRKVTATNLSLKLRTSLKNAPIIYNELNTLLENHHAALPLDLAPFRELNVELFMKIETLITFIRYSRGLAFRPEKKGRSSAGQITEKDFGERITPIGKQIFDLDLKFGVGYLPSTFNPYVKYCSLNLKIFFDVVRSQPKWELALIPTLNSIQNTIDFYNEFVRQIHHYLDSDFQRLAHLMPDKMSAKHTSVESPAKVQKTQDQENSITQILENSPAPVKTSSSKTIKAYLAEKNRIANSSFESTTHYIKEIFKENVTLVCFRFFINRNTHDIPHEIFATLFTVFRHFGNNRRPLSASRGYIGRWEYIAPKQLCAKIIFFLESNEVETWPYNTDLVELIKNHWAEIVATKKPLIHNLDWNDFIDLQGSVEKSVIFNSHAEFNDYQCTIERQEKAKQSAFIQHVLVYLTQSDLYFDPNLVKFPKSLIQGNSIRKADTKKTTKSVKTKKSNSKPDIIKTVIGIDSTIVNGNSHDVVVKILKSNSAPQAMKLLTWVPNLVSDIADDVLVSTDEPMPLTHTESK